jgi:hypothetical protein
VLLVKSVKTISSVSASALGSSFSREKDFASDASSSEKGCGNQ